jgi:hypothetical protein
MEVLNKGIKMNVLVKSLNEIDIKKVMKELSRPQAGYHETQALIIIKGYRNLVEIQKHTIFQAMKKNREMKGVK